MDERLLCHKTNRSCINIGLVISQLYVCMSSYVVFCLFSETSSLVVLDMSDSLLLSTGVELLGKSSLLVVSDMCYSLGFFVVSSSKSFGEEEVRKSSSNERASKNSLLVLREVWSDSISLFNFLFSSSRISEVHMAS